MTSWHSYPSIYNVGHAALAELFDGEVTIEEKVDGSQFSFGVFGGQPRIRSKGLEMVFEQPEKMFTGARDTVARLLPSLRDGWTYRAEYVSKPKHNTLCYERVPLGLLIVFDINHAEESYLSYEEKFAECSRLGLECVPRFKLESHDMESYQKILGTLSCLGGQLIEGFVIKNYAKFGPRKKVLMGKHVSEAFKEVHKGDWRERNPGTLDIVGTLGAKYRTPARWQKAVQHLIEAGKLTSSPRDIGDLIREVPEDVLKECEAEIKAALFEYAWPKIKRSLVSGLPEWYKGELLKKQLAECSGIEPETSRLTTECSNQLS